MKKQMVAERERRGEFIRAEGRKAALRLSSEGTKAVKFNMGVAEQEATRKQCVLRARACSLVVLLTCVRGQVRGRGRRES